MLISIASRTENVKIVLSNRHLDPLLKVIFYWPRKVDVVFHFLAEMQHKESLPKRDFSMLAHFIEAADRGLYVCAGLVFELF